MMGGIRGWWRMARVGETDRARPGTVAGGDKGQVSTGPFLPSVGFFDN